MSQAAHARRLDRLRRPEGGQDDGWMDALRTMDRELRAALALAGFAQALAGIEPPAPVAVREDTPPAADSIAVPPPRSRAPAWGGNNRPGVHDVLTWEEVMRVPWIDGSEAN